MEWLGIAAIIIMEILRRLSDTESSIINIVFNLL